MPTQSIVKHYILSGIFSCIKYFGELSFYEQIVHIHKIVIKT